MKAFTEESLPGLSDLLASLSFTVTLLYTPTVLVCQSQRNCRTSARRRRWKCRWLYFRVLSSLLLAGVGSSMSTAASLLEQEDKQERAALHAHSDDAGVVVQQQQQPNDAAPSIRSNDTAESHTSSILSVTAAKAGKLKSKLKSKLHHSHHSHHDQEHDDDDGEEEEEDDDDEAHGGHRGRHQTSAGEMTPAQSYASSVTHPNATFNASTTTQDNTSAVAHAHRRASSAAASGTPLAKVNSRDFGGGRASLDGATRSASPSVSAGANAAAAERNNTKSPGGASDAASIRSNLPPVESDWRRSAEFHNLFQEVDADEQLVSDYTSAWSKDVSLACLCNQIALPRPSSDGNDPGRS